MKQIDIDRYNKRQDKYFKYYPGIFDDEPGHFSMDIYKKYQCKQEISENSLYNFLFDPKYGWRKMFDKDPDYQKEFWAWLCKKKYAVRHNLDNGVEYALVDKDGNNIWEYIPQMLTGYILEFMQERMNDKK